jgi:hypothetical protein
LRSDAAVTPPTPAATTPTAITISFVEIGSAAASARPSRGWRRVSRAALFSLQRAAASRRVRKSGRGALIYPICRAIEFANPTGFTKSLLISSFCL